MEFRESDIEDKDKFGIYLIRNLSCDKVYVGQTCEAFQRRFWHHRWKLRNGTHDNYYLQKDWDKYGEASFSFEIIEILSDQDCLDESETYWIAYYRKIGVPYNISNGGGGRRGCPMSESAKLKVGVKNRIHMIGKRHSEETKKKMSESRKGKKYCWEGKTNFSDEVIYQIKQLLIAGKKPSIAAKECGVSYELVNSIYSWNNYSHVFVVGWEGFYKNRKKNTRLNPTPEEIQCIRLLYNNGQLIPEIAKQLNRSTKFVKKHLSLNFTL